MARYEDRFRDPNWNCYEDRPGVLTTPDESHLPFEQQSLVFRLRKRADIRMHNDERKSVREGRPDRIAALLLEAADRIARDRHAFFRAMSALAAAKGLLVGLAQEHKATWLDSHITEIDEALERLVARASDDEQCPMQARGEEST